MRIKFLYLFFIFIFFLSYGQKKNPMYTNKLVDETSPYLLQHAYNPVNWHPWGDEALKKAKDENKLIIVSIGYSACHWCHVMEKESFEDEEVAKLMNDNFICIKIDREERPDIDQMYMDAIHLMGQRGGWPLNCIALPNGKPIWGGTYLKKDDWMQQIKAVNNYYLKNTKKTIEYANKLVEGIKQYNLVEKENEIDRLTPKLIEEYLISWGKSWDMKNGGRLGAPKFPLPNNYIFLMEYASITKNTKIKDYVELSLDKMSSSGLYDQIGGGFCRYSTDQYWHVPHFEKMLYDNGQLISLYSKAHSLFRKKEYKNIVYETLDFIERELYNTEFGCFYSALDADSDGEEGRFYVWSEKELKEYLEEDYAIFAEFYKIDSEYIWEENYILQKTHNQSKILDKYKLSKNELLEKIKECDNELMTVRSRRNRPGLDDKSLTSWNAIMLKGYIDAYKAFGDKRFLNICLKNASFIKKNQKKEDGGLFHNFKNGKSNINGFLEDYAFTIEAFIGLYEITFDEKWLNEANELLKYCLINFFDKKSEMFFFTSKEDSTNIITRKIEISDNVIPASNSSISKSLFYLGKIYSNNNYLDISNQMVHNIKNRINTYGPGYSNWAILILHNIYPFYELAIVGENYENITKEIFQKNLPNKIIIGSKKDSELSILKNKYIQGNTTIYVCEDGTCKLPANEINNAIKLIKY